MKKPIKESFSTKAFIKAVNDEFDIETLQMMQALISKRITLLNKMVDLSNPRKVVKGFGK